MKKSVFISGLGQFSAMGAGIAKLTEVLISGTSPAPTLLSIATVDGEKFVQTLTTPPVTLPATIPDGVARRMSRLSKMCFVAVAEALEDSFAGAHYNCERIGLVVGTAYGALDLANEFMERIRLEGLVGASPSLFASSVQNSIASHLSITFNLQGPASTVMTMEHTTTGSLLIAYDWLQQDIVDHVVVVIGDEISEYHRYFMANSKSDGSLNFNSDECTALVGEGAVSFIISNENSLKKYAKISKIESTASAGEKKSRTFIASMGQHEEFSRYKNFINSDMKIESHLKYYGSMLTGSAFELAIAALKTSEDKIDTTCLQLTTENLMQSIHLTSQSN